MGGNVVVLPRTKHVAVCYYFARIFVYKDLSKSYLSGALVTMLIYSTRVTSNQKDVD